jgi:hypothetical protein
MRLVYQGQERIETEAGVIETLLRKGWEIVPDLPPVFSPHVLLLGRIQTRADEIIYGRYSQTTQNNMQARFSELLYLERQRPLTAEETAEQGNLLLVYDWVRQVRAHAGQLTAQAQAGEPVDVETRWPME